MGLPKQVQKIFTYFGNAIAENVREKKNCGNGIAEIGGNKKIKKRKEKNYGNEIAEIGGLFFLTFLAMALPKQVKIFYTYFGNTITTILLFIYLF